MNQLPVSWYLAARVSRRHEVQQRAKDLIGRGLKVTSTWLNPADYVVRPGVHANHGDMTREERGQVAARDLYDIRRADGLILFTEDKGNGSSGGRLVELGYAMGRNKVVWTVGPLENLFCCGPFVRSFDTWQEVLEVLDAQRDTTGQQVNQGT